MTEGKYLLFNKERNIAIVTLNRPEAFNTVNLELWEELYDFQNQIERDHSIRGVVINANGKHFSAGIDLKFLNQVTPEFDIKKLTWLQRLYGRWQEMPIPVVAAVQGLCMGSGVELILGCDIRIAAENAKLSFPEVRFGLSPDMGGTTRLAKLVGTGQAKRMILACEEIGAEEALRIGLVEKVVSLNQLNEEALKLVQKIAAFPYAAVNFAKKGINLVGNGNIAEGLLFEQAQGIYCCGTDDQKEAINAFLEKRDPNFKIVS